MGSDWSHQAAKWLSDPVLTVMESCKRERCFGQTGRSDRCAGVQSHCIAEDIFRDAGWEIDLQIGRTHDDLMANVEFAQPEIMALTLNGEQCLGDLTRLAVAMRFAVRIRLLASHLGRASMRRH